MTHQRLDSFPAVWLVSFAHDRPPGECPAPAALTAREYRTGRVLRLDGPALRSPLPPYPTGPDTLFVAYDAPAALGCHLALGWPVPARVLDLRAESRCRRAGLDMPAEDSPEGALGRPSDDPLRDLFDVLLPGMAWDHALLRGRYTAAVARMERTGIPVDVDTLGRLRRDWARVRAGLVERVDRPYRVFAGGTFRPRRWRAWVNRNHIPWPRTGPGRLDLRLKTFRDMALAHPEVLPVKELLATLRLKDFGLAVGRDGRNRCPLRPFSSKTGRNQPSTRTFAFGPACWVRGLIRPEPGTALAYLDYEQQEFGIGAALSGDAAMRQAYASGDPYLAFAVQAGAAPPGATRATHRGVREQFKQCALGVQYGMGARGLAARLDLPVHEAAALLRLHRETYPRYWRWSDEVVRRGRADGRLVAAFGWTLAVGAGANPRSLRNFPLQANGAEMLRLACVHLTEAGIRVCAPVHDALLVEAPEEDIEGVVTECRWAMRRASEVVLGGFPLRTDVKVIRHPERFDDPRGRGTWAAVGEVLGG